MESFTSGNLVVCLFLFAIFNYRNKPSTIIKGLSEKKTIEIVGNIVIAECDAKNNNWLATVKFKGSSFFGGNSTNEITGEVYSIANDKKRTLVASILGRWDKEIYLIQESDSIRRILFNAVALPEKWRKNYGLTEFALRLNVLEPPCCANFASSDSRRRPDLQLYESGNYKKAQEVKDKIEAFQRMQRKTTEFQPRWFICNDKFEWEAKRDKLSNGICYWNWQHTENFEWGYSPPR